MTTLKDIARSVLYGSGLLGLVHRWRNRRTLTVLMFHRVLPPDSEAFRHAEREFTFSVIGFGKCLDFVRQHYNVITLADLEMAKKGMAALPDRAALITFDDGWRDTLQYAQPALLQRCLSALLFVAAEVPSLKNDRWWQDLLVSVLADKQATARLVARLVTLGLAGEAVPCSADQIHATLAALSESERMALLQAIGPVPDLTRQMLTADELARMKCLGTFTLGAHGFSHVPLTARKQEQATQELTESMCWLQSTQTQPLSMSFPHGAYNDALVQAAYGAGFQWLFTSNPTLTPTTHGFQRAVTLGRVHIPENRWTCANGEVSFAKLAMFLFFRPKAQK